MHDFAIIHSYHKNWEGGSNASSSTRHHTTGTIFNILNSYNSCTQAIRSSRQRHFSPTGFFPLSTSGVLHHIFFFFHVIPVRIKSPRATSRMVNALHTGTSFTNFNQSEVHHLFYITAPEDGHQFRKGGMFRKVRNRAKEQSGVFYIAEIGVETAHFLHFYYF